MTKKEIMKTRRNIARLVLRHIKRVDRDYTSYAPLRNARIRPYPLPTYFIGD